MLFHNRRTLHIDQLWPLTALIVLGCLVALIPIDQIDFWWHLAIGRTIAQTGHIPTVDTFSWTLPPNTPFTYGSWLAEWLLYQLYQVGGLALIVTVRNGLLLAAYAIVGIAAWRRSGSWRLAALAIVSSGLFALNNSSVRPQIFAWVPFALVSLILAEYRSTRPLHRSLWAMPLIMLVWVNLHGSFVIGLGLIGVTLAGETVTYLRGRQQHGSRQQLIRLWLIGLLSAATVGINPHGGGILQFVMKLVGASAAQQFVTEWQSPNFLRFPGIVLPLVLVLIALGYWRSRRLRLTDLLVLAAFTWLGISAIRNLIWFGMIAGPLLAQAWARPERAPRPHPIRRPLLNWSLAACLCLPLIAVQPPFQGSHSDQRLIEPGTPVQAAAWLDQHLPTDARLFNEMGYGSYLIWAVPDHQIAFDGRIELYPYDHWLRYRRIMYGENSLAELAQLGATHVMLQRSTSKLENELSAPHSNWQQVYADDQTIIFARHEAQP